MTDVLVLHDLGASGGGEWAAAFADWPGRVLAPDLPGHNGAPPPVGGQYETGDAVFVALEVLRAEDSDELVVVGVGHNGAAAQILALGGRAAGLVLVDGLGGPWLGPVEIDTRAVRDAPTDPDDDRRRCPIPLLVLPTPGRRWSPVLPTERLLFARPKRCRCRPC